MTTTVPEYDNWSAYWWQPRGPFSVLRWIARARGEQVAPATRPDAVLLDVACGGGMLHPYIAGKGYRHVGVDVSTKSAEIARRHGVDEVVIGDIRDIPLPDAFADVVVAGCCVEHVDEPERVVAECCRLLKPGGTLIIDTIARTWPARFAVITLGENTPVSWAAPKGTHDHRMFVDPRRLARACAANGVPVETYGLFPRTRDLLAWTLGRHGDVPMRKVGYTGIIYGVTGVKPPAEG
ncbi:methyltransferase domain-containing protein [Streptomyces sp. DSM 44915]|uniref:Methyltransferase domain-containing protein n=1 Tax=Streptomyces chisholmiae TaxID=3075540 RepID=A0ABU2JUT9_9ACTN|nr:methyltransferase domain-containing protein [Streptomyces sp. DSM 44915]MDT0268739.1 methyltransferase domain-containing protein [Streptomyces sp. DSM 44915]